MNAYRIAQKVSEPEPTLSYDYAKELDRRRGGVVFNSICLMLAIGLVVGIYPFVVLFGEVGCLIGIASFAFVAVPLAIRHSQQTSANEIEAYEDELLAKARKRSRKKRR